MVVLGVLIFGMALFYLICVGARKCRAPESYLAWRKRQESLNHPKGVRK